LAPKLPRTLHIVISNPMTNCSKAPRGLFVLLRVAGIFTGSVISPSPSLRQFSDRYAIRAGQNLPDKEFRYHRTVIVTAAVHSSLSSSLPPKKSIVNSRRNLRALGRHQPLYFPLMGLQRPKFLVNSRLKIVCCSLLTQAGLIPKLRPFFCRVP